MWDGALKELQEQLKQHPDVLGLVEFGSLHATSDNDLFVVLGDEPESVTSLHFADVSNLTEKGYKLFDHLFRDNPER